MPAELLQTGATEFRTPLGAIRITGPHGPVPFTVSQRPVPDFHKGALEQYYSLSISLDELIAGEAYVVEFDGPDLAYADSDEFGQLNEAIASGITVGISGFNPNEQKITWPKGPSPDLKGYYIIWDDPREGWFTIVKCQDTGAYDHASIDIGWLPTDQDHGDELALVLFY